MSNLRINFVLKSVRGDNKPILLVANFGYKEYNPLTGSTKYGRLKYYTGTTVKLSEWDATNKLPKSKEKMRVLLELEQLTKDIFNAFKLEDVEITPTSLKDELDRKLDRKSVGKETLRIVDYIETVILQESTTKTKSTLTQYKVLANKIKDFEDSSGQKLFAHSLNESQFKQFLDYVRERVNRQNSVWSAYKWFKAVLRDIGRRYDLVVFQPTEKLAKHDKVQQVSEDKVYLSLEQIERIIKFKPKNERLKNVQFILMVLSFTGCRYSDVFKVVPKHKYERNGTLFRYAHFITEKTDTEIKVPILDPLAKFFERNNWEPPHKISEQKFNKYVKELVMLCGLDEAVTLAYTNSRGQKEFETRKLYEFVTSHVGRRSFITNLINFLPIPMLAKVTGHTIKDKSIIFGYNKITHLENAAAFIKELGRIQKTHREDFPFALV